MGLEFDSLNPYQNLVAITADSPTDLVAELKKIQVPMSIVAIVNSGGTRQTAYLMGDFVSKRKEAQRTTVAKRT